MAVLLSEAWNKQNQNFVERCSPPKVWQDVAYFAASCQTCDARLCFKRANQGLLNFD